MWIFGVKNTCFLQSLFFRSAAFVIATATACYVWTAATVIAENKQEKNDEPQNSVVAAEKTASVVRAATATVSK